MSGRQTNAAVLPRGLGGLWGDPPQTRTKPMNNRGKKPLRALIRRARLEYAMMRFESAATIAATIILSPAAYLLAGILLLPAETWIFILGFGLAAEAALVAVSASDPDSGSGHVAAMLERHFGVFGIRDAAIRGKVDQAFEYRIRIEDLLGGSRRALRGALGETVAAVDNWLAGIGSLAARLDRFREDASFQAENKFELQQRVGDLERRAREASDQKIRGQLVETAATRKHQVRMIEELENLMERGELRLEHAVGALGTIYTQVTIFAARGMDEGDGARLASEISDEIEQVDAVLAAMDRIYEPERIGQDG